MTLIFCRHTFRKFKKQTEEFKEECGKKNIVRRAQIAFAREKKKNEYNEYYQITENKTVIPNE